MGLSPRTSLDVLPPGLFARDMSFSLLAGEEARAGDCGEESLAQLVRESEPELWGWEMEQGWRVQSRWGAIGQGEMCVGGGDG
jgi:hypothetical protein